VSGYTITIPAILPSLNVQRRMHYAEYAKMRRSWSWQVWAALNGKMPDMPLPFARITITRSAPKLLDFDNYVGAQKPLIDILRPVSEHNPNGLGLIEDDDESHLVVTYLQTRCATTSTVLVIERGAA
jgi:hypothetical protein